MDDLTAGDLAVGSPVLGASLPGERHNLATAGLAAASPAASPVQVAAPLVRYADHLLPQNSTWLSRVLAAAGKRLDGIPVDIDKLKDPLIIPRQFLPHIAFEYSTDVWSTKWPEQRRRAVADAAILLHQRKGTLYAAKEYARYADGEVLSVERPPMGVFSGPSLTRAQREAWLASLPQIRLWNVRESGTAGRWKAFLGGGRAGHMRSAQFCLGGPAPTPSTAPARLQRRARWVVGGVETDTTVANRGSDYELHLSGAAGQRVFAGDPSNAGEFFVPSDAWKRLVSISPTPRLPWRSAVTPTLQAVISEPERVVVDGDAGYSVFCDEPARMGFFVPTTAPLRIFERYPVLGPDTTPRRPVCQFMGTGRYGFPPHTAHLTVSLPGTRIAEAAGEGIIALRPRFWIPHDPEPLDALCDAVAASKRLSDKILLRIGKAPRFIAGQTPLLAGIDTLIVGRP